MKNLPHFGAAGFHFHCGRLMVLQAKLWCPPLSRDT
jgi:hypothetical protein